MNKNKTIQLLLFPIVVVFLIELINPSYAGDTKNEETSFEFIIETATETTEEKSSETEISIEQIEQATIEETTIIPVTYSESETVLCENEETYSSEPETVEIEQESLADNTEIVEETVESVESVENTEPVEQSIEISEVPSDYQPTIYDVYTQEELDLLYRVVEAEIGIGDFQNKCNVVSVIFNRMSSDVVGGSTLLEILRADQFSSIRNGSYLEVVITDETIEACEYVFINGDVTGGALFFDSTNGNSWASKNREYLFTDSAGHDFFR